MFKRAIPAHKPLLIYARASNINVAHGDRAGDYIHSTGALTRFLLEGNFMSELNIKSQEIYGQIVKAADAASKTFVQAAESVRTESKAETRIECHESFLKACDSFRSGWGLPAGQPPSEAMPRLIEQKRTAYRRLLEYQSCIQWFSANRKAKFDEFKTICQKNNIKDPEQQKVLFAVCIFDVRSLIRLVDENQELR